MRILYDISIHAYALGVKVASYKNPKAKKWVDGRKEVWDVLDSQIQPSERYIWVHCASLGEFEQGRPVVEAIKKKDPSQKVVVTFFSPSGYEVRKDYEFADIVCYIPVDSKKNAQRFLDIVKPTRAFFVKYEFWYHFLTELNDRSIPTYIFSAIFRPSQMFFKPYGKWFINMLKCYEHLFVQNELSKTLLSTIGITNVTVSGDTRFDRVNEIANSAESLPIIEDFIGKSKVVVAGSSWKPDENLLIEFINNDTVPDVKWIFAPHEVSEESVRSIQSRLNKKTIRYSNSKGVDLSECDVLIVDGYGYLTSVYRYATIAYVGGGFGEGIHNILEPATFGMPILIGPKYKKFQEAKDLEEEGAVFVITSQQELNENLASLLTNDVKLVEASSKARDYVEQKVGACQSIVDYVWE